MDSYLNASNSYNPFRVTNLSDNKRCKVSSYFSSIQDESRYQAVDSSGAYSHSQYGLNEDTGFELKQAVRIAQMADANFDNSISYRQQFDSISKDFLSAERENFDPIIGSMYQCLTSQVLCSEQKWWSVFGKYWLIKKERNDDNVKLMKWLMTGGNHGTIGTCRENISLHFEKMTGRGHLVESQSINSPVKALKLELGSQLPVKSLFKYSRDVIKRLNDDRQSGLNSNSLPNWSNEHIDIVCEYKDIDCIELALPNSKIGFFDECVTQKFYEDNPDSHLFFDLELQDVYDEPNSYESSMMSASGELMTFSVGGPRSFKNNVMVESFYEWNGENLANNQHLIEVYHNSLRVYGSPLFRMHYEHPTNPRMRRDPFGGEWWLCNHQSDPFRDADDNSYVATQLSHLPKMLGCDPGNLLSYLPLYDVNGQEICSKSNITSRNMHEHFFYETKHKRFKDRLNSVALAQRDFLNNPSIYVVNRKSLCTNKLQIFYNDDSLNLMFASLMTNSLKWSEGFLGDAMMYDFCCKCEEPLRSIAMDFNFPKIAIFDLGRGHYSFSPPSSLPRKRLSFSLPHRFDGLRRTAFQHGLRLQIC